MLPSRRASVRYPAVRRATFRDDNGLVALRYEKTAQAEPPTTIPVKPSASSLAGRNSIRLSRPPSSSSSSCQSHHRPIVIVPPPGVVAPPVEDHPAFRTSPSSSLSSSPRSPRTSPLDEWKRDSGVARTNSSATIREECEDVDEDEDNEVVILSPKLEEVAAVSTVSVVSPAVQHTEDPFLDTTASARPSLSSIDHRSETMAKMTRSITPSPAPARVSESHSIAPSIPSSVTPKQNRYSQSPRTSKKLTKSPSSQSQSSTPRFRTKSLSEVVHSVTSPMESLLRGASSPARSRASSGSSGSAKTGPKHPSTDKRTDKAAKAHGSSHFWSRSRSSTSTEAATVSSQFLPLDVCIPTDSLLEDDFLKSLSFSKRGSIMFRSNSSRISDLDFDGMMDPAAPLDPLKTTTSTMATTLATTTTTTAATPTTSTSTGDDAKTTVATPSTPTRTVHSSIDSHKSNPTANIRQNNKEALHTLMPPPDIRVLAADVEKESQKRSWSPFSRRLGNSKIWKFLLPMRSSQEPL